MKNKVDLLADRDHHVLSCQDVLDRVKRENRTATKEELAEIASHEEVIKRLDVLIAEVDATEAMERKVNDLMKGRQPVDTPAPRAAMVPSNGEARTSDDVPITVRPRYGSLKYFTGENAEERAYRSGMWCRAAIFGDPKAIRWCENRGIQVRTTMIEGNNLYGGALVPDEMAQTVIDLREQYGVFRKYARVIPMGSDHMNVPVLKTGLSAVVVGEGSSLTESNQTWGTVGLTAKKVGVLIRVSTELMEDAVIDLAEFLASDCARAFAKFEDDAGFKGDTTSTYGGIAGWTHTTRLDQEPAVIIGSVDADTNHDHIPEFDGPDIDGLMAALPGFARPGACFFCSTVFHDLVFQSLAVAGGGNTIQTLMGKFGAAWLGYPIVTTPSLPSVPGTDYNNEVVCLFGDMKQASILGDRRKFTFRVLTERYADEDEIGIVAVERIDIVNHGFGDATDAGAMVGLRGTT